MLKHRLIFILFLFVNLHSYAQISKTDSLLKLLTVAKKDTVACTILVELSEIYIKTNKFDSAHLYADSALHIAEVISSNNFIAIAFDLKGRIYRYENKIDNSIKFHKKAIEKFELLSNFKLLTGAYNNLAISYRRKDENHLALEYYLKAIKIAENLNDKRNISMAANGIGIIYTYQQNYEQALDYFNKAIEIETERNNETGIAINLNSIAWIYELKKDYVQAITFYTKSLEVNQRSNNQKGIAICNTDIGKVYSMLGDYNKALTYFKQSLKVNEQIGDKRYIAISHVYIGEALNGAGKTSQALFEIQHGIDIAVAIGAKRTALSGYQALSDVYQKTRAFENAFQTLKMVIAYKDSIYNEENSKQLNELKTIHEIENREQENELLKRDKVINENKIKSQTLQSYILLIIIIISVVLIVVIYYSRLRIGNTLRKMGLVLTELRVKNEEVESQSENLRIANEQISKKSRELEQKNFNITESINYAYRIQSTLLPTERFINSFFDNFILYLPRDIVSGDFYWIKHLPKNGTINHDKILFAVADCTGHGVPGALLSVLGTEMLNEIALKLKTETDCNAGYVLDMLREMVKTSLNQSGNSNDSRDGMDMAFCIYEPETRILQYAGAYHSLQIVQQSANESIMEIKADRQPVGMHFIEKPFTNHILQMEKNDMIYLFSDGYADQISEQFKRKYFLSEFRNFLLQISAYPTQIQKQMLYANFQDFKGEIYQVDDVLVMGIRL